MKTKEIIGVVCSLIILISLCFGVYFFLENRYALAQELEKTKQRLEEKIQADRLNAVTERVWRMEDRLEDKGREATDLEKEELRKLKSEKEQIEKTLKK